MPSQRRWTVEEKREILEEYESAPWGSKGAVLRRHQVSGHAVYGWASYRDAGLLETGRRKGWQARMTPKTESAEIARLRAEVTRLKGEVEKANRHRQVAEAAVEALGKASALLQVMLESAEPTPDPSLPSVSVSSAPPAGPHRLR